MYVFGLVQPIVVIGKIHCESSHFNWQWATRVIKSTYISMGALTRRSFFFIRCSVVGLSLIRTAFFYFHCALLYDVVMNNEFSALLWNGNSLGINFGAIFTVFLSFHISIESTQTRLTKTNATNFLYCFLMHMKMITPPCSPFVYRWQFSNGINFVTRNLSETNSSKQSNYLNNIDFIVYCHVFFWMCSLCCVHGKVFFIPFCLWCHFHQCKQIWLDSLGLIDERIADGVIFGTLVRIFFSLFYLMVPFGYLLIFRGAFWMFTSFGKTNVIV